MHYYQFNIGDYARDTMHLSELEDLAYRRMLDIYYLKEKPLPRSVDAIARLIRMQTHSECIANVLQEFFVCKNDGYHNSGADKVLNKVYKKSNSAREAALKRWSKNNDLEDANALQTDSERNADAMLPNTQYPIPNTHTNTYADKQSLPACPQQEILKLWSEIMPELTQPRAWDGARAKNLASRWKDGFSLTSSDGSVLYSDKDSGLEFWQNFLNWIRSSDFLMGRVQPTGGRGKAFEIKLDWLVNKNNFLKVFEGDYHR